MGIHIQYADGSVFHALRCELHLLDPQPQVAKSLTLSVCFFCGRRGDVISFFPEAPVCSACWIHAENTQCCAAGEAEMAASSAHLWNFLSTAPLHFHLPDD